MAGLIPNSEYDYRLLGSVVLEPLGQLVADGTSGSLGRRFSHSHVHHLSRLRSRIICPLASRQ